MTATGSGSEKDPGQVVVASPDEHEANGDEGWRKTMADRPEQSPKMAGRLDIVLLVPEAIIPHPHGEALILAHINPSTGISSPFCCIAQSSLHVGK